MGRIGTAINVVIAIPIMIGLLVRSAVSRLWTIGVGRIATGILAAWLLAGVLAVSVTPPEPLNAMWADPERSCREASPGAWPFAKPVLKLSGCVSWSYGLMAESVGWDAAGDRVTESYGTMVAGLTAGGLNREFLFQGVLLTLLGPVFVVYVPVAAAMYGYRLL